jgi:integrase
MASLYKRTNSDHWWYQFRLDGKQYRGSTKTTDKKLAEKIAAAVEADYIRKRFYIPGLIKNNHSLITVWNEYIKSLNNSKRTIDYKNLAFNHIINVFQSKNIEEISANDISNYQLSRKLEVINNPKNIGKREHDINFRWINLEITTLSHFFNFCIKCGYLDKNPCAGIKKLNELSRLKTLSDGDIQKLIAGATNKLTKDLITFLIYTGCRKGEALNLKWDDVDLQNNIIAIKGTKTKYDRYIPISKPLKELLTCIEKKNDCLYLFNDNGRKLGDFRRSFMTACRNAGLKDLRIHDLRHVFASKMVMNGTSLYITGELLGHRTTQMTKRYSHLVPDTLRKAVDDVWNK